MLHGTEATDEVTRKKPFVFLGSIFKRRREHEGIDPLSKPPEISFQDSQFDTHDWGSLHGSHRIQEDRNQPSSQKFMQSSTVPYSLSPSRSPVRSPALIATNMPQTHHFTQTITADQQQSFPHIQAYQDHQAHSQPHNITFSNPSSVSLSATVPPSPAPNSPFFNGRSASPGISGGISSCASPVLVHHTPLRSRDIGEDMEAIRLSRQDNPYLQKVAGSQATLVDEDCDESGDIVQDEDTTHLVSSGKEGQNDALSLEEVHEHLIRSPPPTSVPKTVTGKHFFFFGSDSGDDLSDGSKTLPSSIKGHSLNPLLTKGHEDVLDHHLRQILDTQRKLSVPKEMAPISSSVPGSPARASMYTNTFQNRRSPHSRAHSEENSLMAPMGTGSCPSEEWFTSRSGTSATEGSLAPVQTHGKKHSVPNEMILNKPLLVNAAVSQPQNVASILRPIYKGNQFKRSISLKGGTEASLHSTGGSSSSLTLPIRYPYQPAPQPSNAL